MGFVTCVLASLATIFAGIAAWPIIQDWVLAWRLTNLQKAVVCFAARAQRNAVWFNSDFNGSGAPVVLFFEGALPINDPMAETEALLGLDLLQQEMEGEEVSIAIDNSGYQLLGNRFRRFGITPRGRALAFHRLGIFNQVGFYQTAGGKVTQS